MPDIAVVTGANRGLGAETARQLAALGWTIVLTGRDQAAVAATAATLPGTVVPLALDVTVLDQVRAFAQTLAQRFPRLDVLINNAAGYVDWQERASTADLAATRALFDTNLFGPWHLTQALLPLLRQSANPRIVNVASGAGSHADPAFGLTTNAGAAASYGVSKAALGALTSKWAAELGDTVRVNAVCPGLTATAPGMEAMGARPVTEGARGVVWAATLPANGPTGGFFRDGQPLGW